MSVAPLAVIAQVAFVACPVFGRPPAAAAKKLIAVPGGEPRAVDRVLPVLQALTSAGKIVRAGSTASNACMLKLCGNFMILSVIESCAESFTLAESAGISRDTAYELLAGPGGILTTLPIIPSYGRMVATHDYPPGFSAENGLKDATLICNAAAAGGVDMAIGRVVKDRLTEVVANGGAEQDWASFAELVRATPPK
jgi:3-hydroxyisobutyrate dehydrogenase-like beta-hydroxyacid dehydrogenase